ncbi:hypothetical protein CRN61_17750 [Vibrio vulnificus]|uniref:DUF2846 domain-containing protein n=1 Tax=Vibrio vulnificus TaxID=672 RepID=UPI000C9E3728|nr:DUF2846 domain-containing protein [Vibrio vulnificus]PNG65014.1 hypothetical protein SC81_07810 [Vibrio vulnificus]POC08147.1 hypothetical protein CRN54_16650 [Vibrio vulnificus]POC78036.1 hypothetical protein CRN61_17750 [Vibrio vulnificus]
MKNALTITILSILLTGCASTPVSNRDAKPSSKVISDEFSKKIAGYASLIVKRDSGFSGSACSSRIYLNGVAVVDLDTGEYYKAYLQPGDYVISAKPNGVCGGGLYETTIRASENQSLTYRIGYGSNGDYFIVPTAF